MKLLALLFGATGIVALIAWSARESKRSKAECIARGDSTCNTRGFGKVYDSIAKIFSHDQAGSSGGPIVKIPSFEVTPPLPSPREILVGNFFSADTTSKRFLDNLPAYKFNSLGK